MSRLVKMKPTVCKVCGKLWQVPEDIAKATELGLPYECPVCKKKATHEYAKQYSGKLMP